MILRRRLPSSKVQQAGPRHNMYISTTCRVTWAELTTPWMRRVKSWLPLDNIYYTPRETRKTCKPKALNSACGSIVMVITPITSARKVTKGIWATVNINSAT